MLETINGIDLLIGAAASLGTWSVCRITAAQRLRLAVARERRRGKEAAKVAYRMGHEDGLFDRHVLFGAEPGRPKTGLQGLLDDIEGQPPQWHPSMTERPGLVAVDDPDRERKNDAD